MAATPGHDSLFRTTALGREPLAPPDAGGFHVDVPVARNAGVGVKTSIAGATGPAVYHRMTDIEYLALTTGKTVLELLRRKRT